MRAINKFFLRDVRCFGGEHEFEIRPLTFIIGENSTGKSTVLGCLQALVDFFNYRGRSDIDFNSGPYQMGAFADIARRSRPKNEKFQLGVEFERTRNERGKLQCFLTWAEKSRVSEPVLREIRWVFDKGEIIFSAGEDNQHQSKERPFNIVAGKNQNEFHITTNRDWFGWSRFDLERLYDFLSEWSDDLDDTAKKLLSFLGRQFNLSVKQSARRNLPFRGFGFRPFAIHSIAPIRSKPKRTYDPLKETETPDGSEIPMVLMNLSTSSKEEWEELKKQLLDFGKASALFSDITLRELGRSKSDPFQLQIKVRGPKTNLMDVGYGVSQVLPILVRIFTEQGAKFLLQQPEVHLHPKGQAEMASLLVNANRKRQNSFVIETHSDYMIDRVRIEIMNGEIKPDDVSLIYLEPVGNKVKAHNIRLDSQGNMIGAPEGYRDFFIKESDRLLGFRKD